MGLCCIVFYIDGMLFEFFMICFVKKSYTFFCSHFMFSSRFMLYQKFPGGGGGGGVYIFFYSFSFHVFLRVLCNIFLNQNFPGGGGGEQGAKKMWC